MILPSSSNEASVTLRTEACQMVAWCHIHSCAECSSLKILCSLFHIHSKKKSHSFFICLTFFLYNFRLEWCNSVHAPNYLRFTSYLHFAIFALSHQYVKIGAISFLSFLERLTNPSCTQFKSLGIR